MRGLTGSDGRETCVNATRDFEKYLKVNMKLGPLILPPSLLDNISINFLLLLALFSEVQSITSRAGSTAARFHIYNGEVRFGKPICPFRPTAVFYTRDLVRSPRSLLLYHHEEDIHARGSSSPVIRGPIFRPPTPHPANKNK